MNVLVVGANGQIGKQICTTLAESDRHHVKAMIRNKEQNEFFFSLGVETIIADLEEPDLTYTTKDMDAIIFTAGSGGHTGPDKTILVDLDGAFKMIEAGEKTGVKRFIMVSAINADNPHEGPDAIRHYNVAKKRADERLQASPLNYTIIRPGRLTNEPGTNKVSAAKTLKRGDIPREDVAKTVVTSLDLESCYRKTFALVSGDTPIEEALKAL